jgi:hypothetical protein
MSRTNSELGRVALQPVASPTNQFYSPEVRPSSNDGSKLQQLSQALARVAPQIQGVVDRQFDAHVKGSDMRATADAPKFESMKQFREAVDKGQIAEADNPWYMVQMKQEVARHEARTAFDQIKNDYDQAGFAGEDDPRKVDAWVADQMAPLLKDRDVWEMQALAPAFEQARSQIVNYHIEQRRQAREVERAESFGSDVQGTAAEFNLTDNTQLAALGQRINAKVIEAGKTLGMTKANALAEENIFALAKSERNANIAHVVLANMTTPDGSSRAATGQNKLRLTSLDREITDLQMEDESRAERMHDLSVTKEYRSILDQMKSKSEKQGIPWDQVKFTPDEAQQFSPEAYLKLMSLQSTLTAQAEQQKGYAEQDIVKDTVAKLYTAKLDGTLGQADEISGLKLLAAHSQSAFENAQQALDRIDRMHDSNWGELSTEDTTALLKSQADDTLSFDTVNAVANSTNPDTNKRRMSKEQYFHFMQVATQQEEVRANGGSNKDENERSFKNQLASLITTNHFVDDDPDSVKNIDNDPNVQRLVTAAQMQFDKEYRQLSTSPEFRKLPAPERYKRAIQLVDTISKMNEGLTTDEAINYRQRRDQQQKQQAEAAAAKQAQMTAPREKMVRPPDQVVTDTRPTDPIVSQLADTDMTTLRKVVSAKTVTTDDDTVDRMSNKQIELYKPLNDSIYELNHARANYWLDFSVSADTKAGMAFKAWKSGMARRLALKSRIESSDAVSGFKTKLAQVSQQLASGQPLDIRDKRMLVGRANELREYAFLCRDVGYTVDEVKQMGKDAWAHVPMFADDAHLKSAAPAVMQQLGIASPKDQQRFLTEQLKILVHQKERVTSSAIGGNDDYNPL